MLGTDRRFKTYTDALSESQDGFRIPGIKTPMREESAMRMRNDSRMSLNSNESASNLRQSSIRLGYRDSLIGNQMFNDSKQKDTISLSIKSKLDMVKTPIKTEKPPESDRSMYNPRNVGPHGNTFDIFNGSRHLGPRHPDYLSIQ